MNKYFQYSTVPNSWNFFFINPIPKGGVINDYLPLSYCWISLLSTFSKLFTSVLNSCFQEYVNSENVLVDEQGGFRKGYLCTDQIFSLHTIVKNQMSSKQDTFCACVDLEFVFERINRNMLFYKLIRRAVVKMIIFVNH